MPPSNEQGWTQADQDSIGRPRREMELTGRAWPVSRSEQIDEVARRRASYLGTAYTRAEIEAMALFEARSALNQLSAVTTRVMRDIAFVTNVDSASIASNKLRLSVEDEIEPGAERDAIMASARAIWQRSEIDEVRLWWATTMCSEGEILLETVKDPNIGPLVVMHPFDVYQLSYDRTGKTITRCVIDLVLPGVETVTTGGKIETGDPRSYRRIITPDAVNVWIDGVWQEAESGVNDLGVVPVVRVCYQRVLDGRFCANSGYGYADIVAALDSMLCQMRTIATRHAHPILLGTGVDARESAEIQNQGATIAIPEGTTLEWLEATLAGIEALVKTMIEVRQAMKETLPQFMFADASANSSGTALSYRAANFVMQIDPIREAFYCALEKAIGFGVAMELDQTWSDLGNVIDVAGGAAIPQDVAALAQIYTALREAGAITSADLARYLQASGIASDDKAADVYAAEALAEQAARNGGTSETIARLQALLEMLQAGEPMPAADRMDPGEAETPDPVEPVTGTEPPSRF